MENLLAINAAKPLRKMIELASTQQARVTFIAGEQFIPAITGKRDRDMLSRQPRNVVCRQDRRIRERFFETRSKLLKRAHHIRFEDQFVVLSAKRISHLLRVMSFIKFIVIESD